MVECQCNYLVACISGLASSKGGHRSMDVRTKAMERYMDMVVRTMRHKVKEWASSSSSSSSGLLLLMRFVKKGHGLASLRYIIQQFKHFLNYVFLSALPQVYVSGCSSWYQTAKGFVFAMWPSDLTHFWWMTRRCNLAHFNLK